MTIGQRIVSEVDAHGFATRSLRGGQYVSDPTWMLGLARVLDSRFSDYVSMGAVREAIEQVKDHYPTDVFPDGGESADCKAAKVARLTCENVLREIAEAARKEAAT